MTIDQKAAGPIMATMAVADQPAASTSRGRTWRPAAGDPDETDRVIRAAAGGQMSQAAFGEWIAERIG